MRQVQGEEHFESKTLFPLPPFQYLAVSIVFFHNTFAAQSTLDNYSQLVFPLLARYVLLAPTSSAIVVVAVY